MTPATMPARAAARAVHEAVVEAVVDNGRFRCRHQHVPRQFGGQGSRGVAPAHDQHVAAHAGAYRSYECVSGCQHVAAHAGASRPAAMLSRSSTAPHAPAPPTTTATSTHSQPPRDGASSSKNSRRNGRAIAAP